MPAGATRSGSGMSGASPLGPALLFQDQAAKGVAHFTGGGSGIEMNTAATNVAHTPATIHAAVRLLERTLRLSREVSANEVFCFTSSRLTVPTRESLTMEGFEAS